MKQILQYGPDLRNALEDYIQLQAPRSTASLSADYYNRLLAYATSGKLLRGCLVCFSYEAFSGQPPDKNAMSAAMALELIHSGLLMHDDVMDNDVVRRGQPALHAQYQSLAEANAWRNPRKFGENMALCAGDATIFLALKLINSIPEAEGMLARQFFTDSLSETCFGQMHDITLETRPGTPRKSEIYELMRTKTAAYTIALPLNMGAVLAKQAPSTLKELNATGESIGIIFQIRDDELGLTGNPTQTGKAVGADIREGKKTLAYYYLMQKCSPNERQAMRRIFGNPTISDQEVLYVQKLIKKLKIPTLIMKDIDKLKAKTHANLKKLQLSATSTEEFESLLSFCAQRKA